jgi:hypothetical protein
MGKPPNAAISGFLGGVLPVLRTEQSQRFRRVEELQADLAFRLAAGESAPEVLQLQIGGHAPQRHARERRQLADDFIAPAFHFHPIDAAGIVRSGGNIRPQAATCRCRRCR